VQRDYDPAFFERLVEVEERHFWFRSRNRVIGDVVRRAVGSTTNPSILEVGCGTGNVLRGIEQTCPHAIVTGMDIFLEGLQYAKRRSSAALLQGDMHHPPFSMPFDIIGLFDVLEHMPADMQVLLDVGQMLRPGGTLIITVPAHQSLWSYFDEASHHYRRYEPAELNEKFANAGYDVEYLTQYMMSAYPLMWIGRRLSGLTRRLPWRKGGNESVRLTMRELRPIPIVNGVLRAILSIEERWLRRGHTLPLGTSLLVVARKRTVPRSAS